MLALVVEAPGDPALVQIVGRHFHLHLVAHGQPNPTALAHFPGDVRQHFVVVLEFHPEHCAGQNLTDHTHYLD